MEMVSPYGIKWGWKGTGLEWEIVREAWSEGVKDGLWGKQRRDVRKYLWESAWFWESSRGEETLVENRKNQRIMILPIFSGNTSKNQHALITADSTQL
jgi:hypothetical protein